jgi:hypothetical protein
MAGISSSHLIIRLKTDAPSAEFTLNGRKRPVQVTYGLSRQRPTLDIELAADTLHCILLGRLSLKKALANGDLLVQGPAWKVMILADLFYRGREIYPQVLQDHGLLAEEVQ